jgi:phage head maturation protease
MTTKRMYVPIEKSEKEDDGTIRVWGYASSEAKDSDGETVTADCMRAALPDYMRFGAVREMHDAKKAAGTAIEAEITEDGRTWFGAHIVDPMAVKKVETGVYKGFSIGGKVPPGGRDGNIIKALRLIEVSLVDRPANPEAVISVFKAEGAEQDDADPEDTADEKDAAKGDDADVQKSLYGLSELARLTASVQEFGNYSEFETDIEGRNMEIPGKVRDAAKMLAEALAGMATTEAAQVAAEGPDKADTGGDTAKVGARFSSTTKAALKAAHEACKAADKALADLGYEADEEMPDKAESAGVKKVDVSDEAATEVAALMKACGISGATALDAVKAMAERITEQSAEIERMKALPAHPKGYANGIAVSKAADAAGQETELQPVMKSDGSTNDVATLIKAAQRQPIRIN